MLESQIQSQILQYLEYKIIHHIRFSLGGIPFHKGNKVFFKKNPMSGFPDIFGWQKTGVLWGLEVKKKGGKLSEPQKNCLEFLKSLGSLVTVAYTFDEAKIWIDTYEDNFIMNLHSWPT